MGRFTRKTVLMMVLLTVLSQTAIGWGAERVVRLEYWFGGLPGSQTEAMSEIISLFEAENPNVKVDMVLKGIPEKYEPEALPLAIAGGVPCDVAYLSGPQVFEWSLKGGFLVPLNGLLQASRIQQFENNCLPGPRSLFSRKGIWYGAPFRTDTRGMYMNVDLLEGAGFGSTIGPKDIAELDRYAAKLTRWSADGKVEILGFAPNGNNAMDELIWLWAFGGEFLDEETGKLMFAGKAAHLDALTWIQGYANQYGARARATLANFMNGSAAMHINSTTRLSVLPEQAPELNWYTSHIPVMPQANPVSYGGVLGLAIPVGARYPNEAARFVAFLARPDIQVRWYRLTQTLPTRVEAFKQILPLISDHRERILVEQLPVTRVAPPLYPQLKQVWEGNLNKLRLSEISPQVFLEDLQRKMEPAYREIFTGR